MAESIVPQGNEIAKPVSYKHGHSPWKFPPSPTYNSWRGMLERCKNASHTSYHNYGGRGIKVCDRWSDFQNFLEDMGPRPEGMSLDRKDPNGHYCPENCRWATDEEQARNRSDNRMLTYDGRTQCLADWAKELGIVSASLLERLNTGWSVEQALGSPKGSRKKPLATLTYNGVTKSIGEWAKEKGFNGHRTITNRIRLGWDVDRILNTPVREKRQKDG